MKSLILQTATRYLFPIFVLFSLIMLLHGHDEPGGGFIGGLLAATAFCLLAVSEGVPMARRMLRVEEHQLIAIGLTTSAVAGMIGLVQGRPFLDSGWSEFDLPFLGHVKVGTPLLFDFGVYQVVIGVVLMMVFALAEQTQEEGG